MITKAQTTQLRELLTPAQAVLVIVGAEAKFDQLAAASALYLSLKQAGKSTTFLAPNSLRDQLKNNLNGAGELKTELGNQNLVVSFDYLETAVDKVSYHIGEETKKFYLTIKPKKGQEPLNSESVEFSYAGASADLIFLVGVHELESLDQLYFGYESLYKDATTITLHNFEPEIGSIRLDVSGTSSMSETTARLLSDLSLPLDADIATNLLYGIEISTNSFQSLTTADTFATVAELMRLGARRNKQLVAQFREAPQQPIQPLASVPASAEIEQEVTAEPMSKPIAEEIKIEAEPTQQTKPAKPASPDKPGGVEESQHPKSIQPKTSQRSKKKTQATQSKDQSKEPPPTPSGFRR